MPNYRSKSSKNRNKSRNRNKREDSGNSSRDAKIKAAKPQSNSQGHKRKDQSAAIQQTRLSEDTRTPATVPHTESGGSGTSNEAAAKRMKTEQDLISPETVPHEKTVTVHNTTATESLTEDTQTLREAESEQSMGGKASKVTHTPIAADEEALNPSESLHPPVSTPRRGKVIVHRIVYEGAEAEAHAEARTEDRSEKTKGPTHKCNTEDEEQPQRQNDEEDEGYTIESPPNLLHPDENVANQVRGAQIQIEEINDKSAELCTDGSTLPIINEVESDLDDDIMVSGQASAPGLGSTDYFYVTPTPDETPSQILRQQKRAALEDHFLPQLLNPRYLDSIMEENSDISDSTEHIISPSASSDQVHSPAPESKPEVPDTICPKSQADLLKARPSSGQSCPAEQRPIALVVAAGFVEDVAPEQVCTTLASSHIPESESAEVVFINSASSSNSDLVELEGTDKEPSVPPTAAVGLDTDAKEILSKPQEEDTSVGHTSTPTPTPSSTPPPTATTTTTTTTSATATATAPATASVSTASSLSSSPEFESRALHKQFHISEQRTLHIPPLLHAEPSPSGNEHNALADTSEPTSASNRVLSAGIGSPESHEGEQRFATDSSLCADLDSADSSSLRAERLVEPEPVPVPLTESVKMNNVREILSRNASSASSPPPDSATSSRLDIGETDTHELRPSEGPSGAFDHEPSPPPIPPPPKSFKLDNDELPVPAHPALAAHDFRQLRQPPHQSTLDSQTSPLTRQESADSHCSDSTSHSQCTAINVATATTAATTTATTADTASSKTFDTPSSLPDHGRGRLDGEDRSVSAAAASDSAGIKKLRLLCAETVSTLPYGDEVLEELAKVAQNIGEEHAARAAQANGSTATAEMPYPLPDLPHIDDLQLSISSTGRQAADKPSRQAAAKAGAWLGLPTDADPNVLVCLSPSQRSAMEEQQKRDPANGCDADELLDAHQRFVDRRGYHEFTASQVQAMDSERSGELQMLQTAAAMKRLRKSLTPPPPPVPPPPVPVKSSDTAAKAQNATKTNVLLAARAAAMAAATAAAAATATKMYADANLENGNRTAPNSIDREENKHRLLAIIQDTNGSIQNPSSAQQPSSSSSFQNNSRQASGSGDGGSGGEHDTHQPPEPPLHDSRQRTSTQNGGDRSQEDTSRPISQSSRTTETQTTEEGAANMRNVENAFANMFPSRLGQGPTNAFDRDRKRFSNIEISSRSPEYCSQLATRPKRFSNIETHSFESQRRITDGEVVYDVSGSRHESSKDGDPSLADRGLRLDSFGLATGDKKDAAPTTDTTTSSDHQRIMSALKLTATTTATANGDVPLRDERKSDGDLVKGGPQQSASTSASASAGTGVPVRSTYDDDFRQRAKPIADGTATLPIDSTASGDQGNRGDRSNFAIDNEKLLKDLDELSKQLNRELESGRALKKRREQSASLYDLSQMPLYRKDLFEDLKRQRHKHIQELEQEIERSMKSRQQLFSKHTPATSQQQAKTTTPRVLNIPIQLEDGRSVTAPLTGTSPASVEIPIQVQLEDSVGDVPPKTSTQVPTKTEYTPYQQRQQGYEPWESSGRSRRAESMLNLSSNGSYYGKTGAYNPLYDDWAKYANDLGSSENIARPLAREVEMCYHRQRNNAIRAPRLTASTNDLTAGSQFYDSYSPTLHSPRRYYAPLTDRAPQRQLPVYSSCYSMLERDPNPIYVSTTSRRGLSQASTATSQADGAYAHEPSEVRPRRASMPRELHEQQLKYLSSKEEQLKSEFERLQSERRRLMEDMHREPAAEAASPHPPQAAQHPMRDVFKAAQKLPTLSENEVFRQQMAEEWLKKVAEREERRLQKIIKISKIHEETTDASKGPKPVTSAPSDISAEFLNRVKERRTKLSMPADSDWESGAESQPLGHGNGSESEEMPPVKIIDGKVEETDLRRLPQHLREFAKLSNLQTERIDGGVREHREEEERHQEQTANSMTNAVKKSSLTKTIKISRPLSERSTELAAPSAGIWTPKSHSQTPPSTSESTHETSPNTPSHTAPPTPPSPPPQPVWTTSQASPPSARKEFRPVRFESPTLPRRYVLSSSTDSIPPPWHDAGHPENPTTTRTNTASCTNLNRPAVAASDRTLSTERPFAGSNASVSDKIKSFERSASTSELYPPLVRRRADQGLPLCKPNEVIFNVKHEYMSEPETENGRPKKMAQLGRRQYDGIGPVTNDGMPIILRSEVKEPHQHEWYKRLYQTIHKQKHSGRAQYKPSGYQSEPEPNYEPDYSTVKYRTVNPQRLQSVSSLVNVREKGDVSRSGSLYGTMPNPVKSEQNLYRNQPGRIEDYVTGHSSISEKARKEWWDEVMDIFNGHFEQEKLSSHYTEGNLARALAKESGYASDSNLVFRKTDIPQRSLLSPVEQKQAYKSLQAGGEPPLFGFRKPAPEKPKVSPNRYYESDVNIHFKTPVRQEFKSAIPEEELAARQAEQMQKLYQEERRRKYLQELQDMNARRHTDNFTPSQKSPIPLNRYDDFASDLTPKSPSAAPHTRTVARALYNFQGQNARELSFKKGDIIYIRRAIDKNWYEGEHHAMLGLFPANYVEIIGKESSGHASQQRKPAEGQARAKYTFQAQSGVELSLNKGELVTLTRRVDDNWFEGRIANRKGIFPVSYVEVLSDIGAEDVTAKTGVSNLSSTTNGRPSLNTLRTNINDEFNALTKNGTRQVNGILKETRKFQKTDILHVDTTSEPLAYRALYKYRPQNSDELELLEGDVVHVLEKCDDGWFVGTSLRTGCFGTFPGNYVERL